jgi:hypothetical protein
MSRIQGAGGEVAAVSRRGEAVAFFALTFVVSWSVQVPLALSATGVLPVSPPMALHYLASFGPLLAALVVTAITRGLRVAGTCWPVCGAGGSGSGTTCSRSPHRWWCSSSSCWCSGE